MVGDGGIPDGAERTAEPHALAQRGAEAHRRARDVADRLASTADDIATTLDSVADAREARAETVAVGDAARWRREAHRARGRAEAERRDGRLLRETWGLPS